MAPNWLSQERPFCGVIFGHLLQVSIGQCVKDLEIIAKGTDSRDWLNALIRLPL
jgi:hypothetical protein